MSNECWNCARVGKCNLLRPCERFVRFRAYVTTREIAALCGTSERTLYRRLKSNASATLSWIKRTSGFSFIREARSSRDNMFVLKTNDAENTLKLTKALKKLEGGKNGV